MADYDSEVYLDSSDPEGPLDGYEGSSSYCSSGEPGSESVRQRPASACSSRSDMSFESPNDYSGQDNDFESSDSSVMVPEACTTPWDSDNSFMLDDVEVTDMSEAPSDDSDGNDINSPEEFSSVFKESLFKQLHDGSNVVYIEAMILIFQYAIK